MELSELDLRFLVETVATKRDDPARVMELVRGKDDLLEPMLEDPKLAARLLSDEELFVRISPNLLFSILLRQVKRELQHESYIFEIEPGGERVPVFEAEAVAAFISEKPILDYLVDLLGSFVKTRSTTVYRWERKRFRKRRFSDMDLEDMKELANLVEPPFKGRYYKRAADIALFLTGVYPDHFSRRQARIQRRLARQATVAEYEEQGRYYYRLAARESPDDPDGTTLERMGDQITLARRALNALADRYLRNRRDRYFTPSE